MSSLYLFPSLPFEPKLCMFIINGYYTKSKRFLSLDSLLTTLLSTKSINFFKSTRTDFNLLASNSENLSISNLSTSDFKLTF